ncbi:MAG TPA: guanylate kinase [Anaerolineales bacterium]|jgi:guanylate kinase
MTDPVSDYDILHPEPLMIVVSGPSGAGKDSVLNRMKECGFPFHFVVTVTTRPMRAGEVDGRDYFFVDHSEFARMMEAGELLEYAKVYEDFKGIPKKQVYDALASHKDVILRVDVQGAATIRKLVPDAILIFLTAESEEDLVSRLRKRSTETPNDFILRIATARQELKRVNEFDYVVINKESCLDETVKIISSIIIAEHQRVVQRTVKL